MKPSPRTTLKSQIAVSAIITLLILGFIQFGRFLSILPEKRADTYLSVMLILCFVVLNGYYYLKRAGRSQYVPPPDLDMDMDESGEEDADEAST